MNLYQWIVFAYPDDYANEQEAKDMFQDFLNVFNTDNPNPVHWGDCTKAPQLCAMCLVAQLVDEYGNWCSAHRTEVWNTVNNIKPI